MMAKSRGGLLSALDRQAAARLVGGTLPASATNLKYLRWQPSGDLSYYEALVGWDSTREQYLEFIHERNLTTFAAIGPGVLLPIDWRPSAQIERPSWWHPTSETPGDAAAGRVGAFGSIVAKWETGRVYVMITDTGNRA